GVPMSKRASLRLDPLDQLERLGPALLVFDAGVEVFRVLPDDDQVDIVEAGADALVGLARAYLRIEIEGLPQADVHRAEATADRRRDRPLDRNPGAPDRFERLLRQRIAVELVHHVGPRLLHVPLELGAGRLEDAAGCFGQLRTGAVAGDQRHFVRHGRGAYPS